MAEKFAEPNLEAFTASEVEMQRREMMQDIAGSFSDFDCRKVW